jgi:hypothetical protein
MEIGSTNRLLTCRIRLPDCPVVYQFDAENYFEPRLWPERMCARLTKS